jgi:curli biogenesis system outer membrane secretion channel CsgG
MDRSRSVALVFTLGCLVASAASGPSAYAGDKPRVAVIEFENNTGWWGRDLGASAATQLTAELTGSGAFTVVDRRHVDAVFNEQHMGQTGAVIASQSAKLGQMLGVQYLITGQVTHFNIDRKEVGAGKFLRGLGGHQTKAESGLTVNVVRVDTGENVASARGEGDVVLGRGISSDGLRYSADTPWNPTLADEALEPAIAQLVAALVQQQAKLPAVDPAAASPPKIVKRAENGSIYIDHGQNRGMTLGRRFHVMRIVDTIPGEAGEVLDYVTERVGTIEVANVLERSAICTVVQGEAQEGDLLEAAGGS